MAIEIISCAEEEKAKEVEEANKQRNCYKNFLSPIYGPENVVGVFDRVASTYFFLSAQECIWGGWPNTCPPHIISCRRIETLLSGKEERGRRRRRNFGNFRVNVIPISLIYLFAYNKGQSVSTFFVPFLPFLRLLLLLS